MPFRFRSCVMEPITSWYRLAQGKFTIVGAPGHAHCATRISLYLKFRLSRCALSCRSQRKKVLFVRIFGWTEISDSIREGQLGLPFGSRFGWIPGPRIFSVPFKCFAGSAVILRQECFMAS